MAEESDFEEKNTNTDVDGEGVFLVQILQAETHEEFIPKIKDVDTEGEDESPIETDADTCTYQLGPTTTVKPKKITYIAERIMKEFLHDKSYANSDMKDNAKKISSAVREAVKKLGLDRYRVICQVTIGEKCNQDVAMAFLCLWKHEFDHYSVARYESECFFATALVFVVYKQ